jgi:hypothetical protein
MKKSIYSLLACVVLALSICACNNAGTESKTDDSSNVPKQEIAEPITSNDSVVVMDSVAMTKIEVDKNANVFSATDLKNLKNIVQKRIECIQHGSERCQSETNRDCTMNYCDNDDNGHNECLNRIVCCHEITPGDFQVMTGDLNGYATFDSTSIANIVVGANCKTQHIKFSISWLGNYIMARVNERPDDSKHTYYSVALLQGIYNKGVDSIRLYRGRNLTDANRKEIPFAVYYKGQDPDSPTYYDVSDTQP